LHLVRPYLHALCFKQTHTPTSASRHSISLSRTHTVSPMHPFIATPVPTHTAASATSSKRPACWSPHCTIIHTHAFATVWNVAQKAIHTAWATTALSLQHKLYDNLDACQTTTDTLQAVCTAHAPVHACSLAKQHTNATGHAIKPNR
jgi:hypothetical protein